MAAALRLSRGQRTFLIPATAGIAAFACLRPEWAGLLLYVSFFCAFSLSSLIRLAAALAARSPPQVSVLPDHQLPTYTVVAPLFREADMAAPLVANLSALDYPKSKLQVLFVLETGDTATLWALRRAHPLAHMRIIIAPPGWPRTKPRACNIALGHATGERLVIYDAEDRPDPGQLREAAAQFAAGSARLACLQAPMRIEAGPSFLERQFAMEYALLFEVVLPAFARFGLPFPLGGTSNHFVTRVLRTVGGWDPYNVTEDADLGFRLAAEGYEIGVLTAPTVETAPDCWRVWVVQRARWVKGYIQTLAVHTRRSAGHRIPTLALLMLTIGLSTGAAFLHGPLMLLLVGLSAWAAFVHGPAPIHLQDLTLLMVGWASFAAALIRARTRTGQGVDVPLIADMAAAPFYWMLQSAAALRAVAQFVLEPHRWDKTPHLIRPKAPAVLDRGGR